MSRAPRRSGHRSGTTTLSFRVVARWLASGAIVLVALTMVHVTGGAVDPGRPPPIPGVGHAHPAPAPALAPVSGTVTWSTGDDDHADHGDDPEGHDPQGGPPEPMRKRSLAAW